MSIETRHVTIDREAIESTMPDSLDKMSRKIEQNERSKQMGKKTKNANEIFDFQTVNQVRENVKNAPPQKKLVGDLIYDSEQIILFGATNLGKSILATQIAMAIAEGKNLTLGDVTLENESDAQKVIYYDFELSDSQFTKRLGGIEVSDNFRRATIKRGEILEGSPSQVFQILKEGASIWGAKVIIIDNISKIGSRLEEADRATEFMGSLWDLCRYYGYTVIILTHTPKRDKKIPLTADSISGSSKISQLTDAIIGINEIPSDDDHTKVYLKQIKTRNGTRTYGEMNVICTKIIKDEKGFVKHEGYGRSTELASINGQKLNILDKKLATAYYFKYGSLENAAKAAGIAKSTLNKRKNVLKERFPEDYKLLKEMTPAQLDEHIKLLQAEDKRL